MRGCALALAFSLTACSGAARHPQRAAKDDLSALQALPGASIPLGWSGAPVSGITVSGTVTNTGSKQLHCSAGSFLLLTRKGDAIPPARQFCNEPVLGPGTSGYFTVTFVTAAGGGLRIRFEHPSGTYETHELILPPQ